MSLTSPPPLPRRSLALFDSHVHLPLVFGTTKVHPRASLHFPDALCLSLEALRSHAVNPSRLPLQSPCHLPTSAVTISPGQDSPWDFYIPPQWLFFSSSQPPPLLWPFRASPSFLSSLMLSRLIFETLFAEHFFLSRTFSPKQRNARKLLSPLPQLETHYSSYLLPLWLLVMKTKRQHLKYTAHCCKATPRCWIIGFLDPLRSTVTIWHAAL